MIKKSKESFESFLRRFKKECEKERLYQEIKKRRYFIPKRQRVKK